jgi:hypothetical protein
MSRPGAQPMSPTRRADYYTRHSPARTQPAPSAILKTWGYRVSLQRLPLERITAPDRLDTSGHSIWCQTLVPMSVGASPVQRVQFCHVVSADKTVDVGGEAARSITHLSSRGGQVRDPRQSSWRPLSNRRRPRNPSGLAVARSTRNYNSDGEATGSGTTPAGSGAIRGERPCPCGGRAGSGRRCR